MAFVNIDYLDLKSEPYDFSLLSKISTWRTSINGLTVDRERDIWLRKVYENNAGDPRENIRIYRGDYWGFYWKGIFFVLETFKSNCKYDEKRYFSYHAKVRVLATSEALSGKPLDCLSEAEKAALLSFPKALEPQKLEILKDLKAALECHSDGSTLFKKPDCTVELEFQGVTL